jgi:hypothetical protein
MDEWASAEVSGGQTQCRYAQRRTVRVEEGDGLVEIVASLRFLGGVNHVVGWLPWEDGCGGWGAWRSAPLI